MNKMDQKERIKRNKEKYKETHASLQIWVKKTFKEKIRDLYPKEPIGKVFERLVDEDVQRHTGMSDLGKDDLRVFLSHKLSSIKDDITDLIEEVNEYE